MRDNIPSILSKNQKKVLPETSGKRSTDDGALPLHPDRHGISGPHGTPNHHAILCVLFPRLPGPLYDLIQRADPRRSNAIGAVGGGSQTQGGCRGPWDPWIDLSRSSFAIRDLDPPAVAPLRLTRPGHSISIGAERGDRQRDQGHHMDITFRGSAGAHKKNLQPHGRRN